MSAAETRAAVEKVLAPTLCRTCMRPIAFETRTEPGYLPREGWYDDARTDPLVCFKAVNYRHVPLTDRERAYYEAGCRAVAAALEPLIADTRAAALEDAAEDMDRFAEETYAEDIFVRPTSEQYAEINALLKRERGHQLDGIAADVMSRAIRVQANLLRDRATRERRQP